MGGFVLKLNEDINYELGYIIKEIRKKLGKYTKTECINDLVKQAVDNKEETIRNILKTKNVKQGGK